MPEDKSNDTLAIRCPDMLKARFNRVAIAKGSTMSAEDSEGKAGDVVNECIRGFWQVEPSVGRVADGISHRVHQLKALGNAQVPLQAAVAWRLLGGQ